MSSSNKKALGKMANAYTVATLTPNEKKSVTSKSFTELSEFVNSTTLQQCGLHDIAGFNGDAGLIQMSNRKQRRGT